MDKSRKVFIACDHGAYEMKEEIKTYINTKYKNKDTNTNIELIDMGTNSTESVDFPDYAEKACLEILKDDSHKGILICGSGIGISIAANKFKGIRCALVHDYFTAKISREHNNSNAIAFGARVIGIEVAKTIVDGFFQGNFLTDEKYQRRNDKITEIEKKYLYK